MMFVISIAVLISNITDAMFRRAKTLLDGRQLIMYHLAFEVQNTIVTYSRDENSLRLQGLAKVTSRYFEITDTLQITLNVCWDTCQIDRFGHNSVAWAIEKSFNVSKSRIVVVI